MTAKILPTILMATLVLALLGSYAGSASKRPVGRESCYRSQAGKGLICLWETSLGEKCWRTEQESACTKAASVPSQSRHRIVRND